MTETKQLSKLEIIEETVEYYKNNPRSLSLSGSCLYQGEDGELCAFARVVVPEERKYLTENEACSMLMGIKLLPQYEKHEKDVEFWLDIQQLHDRSRNWTPNNSGGNDLTQDGKIFVNERKEKYKYDS